MKRREWAGKRVGMLTVIKLTDKRSSDERVLWLCHCDCGGKKLVSSRDLNNKNTRSCG